MAAPELYIPEQESEPPSAYFSRVVNTLLADNLDFAWNRNTAAASIEGVALSNPTFNFAYDYQSFDLRSGIETMGLVFDNHRTKRPFGEDYEGFGPPRGGSRSIAINRRHYFKYEDDRFIHRIDQLGGRVIKTALTDEIPDFGRIYTESAIEELHEDLNSLRRGWTPIRTSSGI